jgi:hypothetical protein
MPEARHILVPSTASPEDAAAVAAAIEQFLRDTAPPPAPSGAGSSHNPWRRAGLLEGVGREPDGPSPWGDGNPWG